VQTPLIRDVEEAKPWGSIPEYVDQACGQDRGAEEEDRLVAYRHTIISRQ
jgi:hypothetical protein